VVAALAAAACAFLGAYLGAARPWRRRSVSARASGVRADVTPKLVDTSALIDGRIAGVAAAGFLEGTLLVPGFVLAELQAVADASDPLKRSRGKRGFDVLERLRADPRVAVEVISRDVAATASVDGKLVELARMLGAALVTTDHPLARLAEAQGVTVLNVNALVIALKPPVLAGETMSVQVLREGKELGQGVGYLEDGTMVVVEGGRTYLGRSVDVTVTSVLQTGAGRMIFTRPRDPDRAERAHA
jgi:uncharacterized protein YacL